MTEPSPVAPVGALRPDAWSIVIPYYNEEDFLEATLASVGAQEARPLDVILVDNASTDRSAEIAAAFREKAATDGINVVLLREETPGQAAALETGIAAVATAFTAICDADTIYPPDYLLKAQTLIEEGGPETVAAIAFGLGEPAGPDNARKRFWKGRIVANLMPHQCHGGGYAHAFRTEVLKDVGGYAQRLWPYCLKDHELMHRVSKRGRLAYSPDHWCLASDRRASRSNVRWTLFERIMYHVTPFSRKDWFFYDFLRSRFEARGLSELQLRKRDWEDTKPAR